MRRMFIRYCVRSGMNRLKRYCFGKVFSRSDSLGMKCSTVFFGILINFLCRILNMLNIQKSNS